MSKVPFVQFIFEDMKLGRHVFSNSLMIWLRTITWKLRRILLTAYAVKVLCMESQVDFINRREVYCVECSFYTSYCTSFVATWRIYLKLETWYPTSILYNYPTTIISKPENFGVPCWRRMQSKYHVWNHNTIL